MDSQTPDLDSAQLLRQTALGVISQLEQTDLTRALRRSFDAAEDAIEAIGRFFDRLPTRSWTQAHRACFAASWKATHLKMLAIYGLSCRIQREALADAGHDRGLLFLSAAHNAESSYEDLGLDYDGVTHAQLYETFAGGLVGDASWSARGRALREAEQFGAWIYRNMVVDPIQVGLLTNILSEIYNHGEYTAALAALSRWFGLHSGLAEDVQEEALCYVKVHVQAETEVAHFLVVLRALEEYNAATGQVLDPELAERIFTEYLRRLGGVFGALNGAFERGFDVD